MYKQLCVRTSLWAFAALAIFCYGCGGGLFSGGINKESEPTGTTQTGPLMKSALGFELVALGQDGRPSDPNNAHISAAESTQASAGRVVTVTDTVGELRPVYLRLDCTGTVWHLENLELGDWAADAKVLVLPLKRRDGSIDIGVVPMGEPLGENLGLTNKVILHITLSDVPSKSLSLWPVSDKTGEAGGENAKRHSFYPFVQAYAPPNGDDTCLARWQNRDNHLDVYAAPSSEDPDERNKLDAVGVSLVPNVFDKAQYVSTDTEATFKFGFQAHGDYDLNGEVNIADLSPIAAHWQAETGYAAFERNTAITNPFRPDTLAKRMTAANVADGSMDGRVFVDLSAYENLKQAFMDPPSAGDLQYADDISPIWVHYEEDVARFKVSFLLINGSSRIDKLDVDFAYDENSTVANERQYFTLPVPLRTAAMRENSLVNGVYDVKIQLIPHDSSDYDPEHEPEITYLNAAFEVTGHPAVDDSSAPFWFIPGQEGAQEGWPNADTFRSTVIKVAPAVDPDTFVSSYPIKVYNLTDSTNQNPTDADVWNFGTTPSYVTFDEFTSGSPYYKVQFSGASLGPTWDPGDKVRVIVTARNDYGATYGVASNGQWIPGTTIDHVDTYISYDYSAPYWSNDDWSAAPNTDVKRASFGVMPISAPPGYQSGYFVYWGIARDPETGISGYRLYFDRNGLYGGDGSFSESDFNAMRSARQYIDTRLDYDLNDQYDQLKLYKRFFLLTASTPAESAYVCIRAVNGEGDESQNNLARNLATMPVESIFKRLTVSTDLNTSYDSGDMASAGVYSDNDDRLLIVGANNSPVAPVGAQQWSHNIECWQYQTDKSPLNPQAWLRAPRAGSPIAFYNNVRDDIDPHRYDITSTVAPHAELSAEYVSSGSSLLPRVCLQTLGSLDLGGGVTVSPRWGYVHSFEVSDAGLVTANGYTGNPYVMGATGEPSTYLALPTDLSCNALGFAYPWHSKSVELGVTVHGPAFQQLSAFGQQNLFGERVFSPSLLVGPNFKSGALDASNMWRDVSIMESYSDPNSDYFSSSGTPAVTIWGMHDYASSSENDRKLYLYWHKFGEMQRKTETLIGWYQHHGDQPDPPYVCNQITPYEPVYGPFDGPYSWEQSPPLPVANVLNGLSYGTPATLLMRKGAIDVACTVFNGGSALGQRGLGLALSIGPNGATQSNSALSTFPQLVWKKPGSGWPRLFRDSIDSIDGVSVLDASGGQIVSFRSDGAWTPMEGTVSNPVSWSAVKPITITFVQANADWATADVPAYQLWYAEIYNAFDLAGAPTPNQAFVVYELVDSLEITNHDRQSHMPPIIPASEFRPIWCAMGVNSGATLGFTRPVPVIAYGAKLGTGPGEIKVACLDYQFAPLGFGYLYKYNANKNGGALYGGIAGSAIHFQGTSGYSLITGGVMSGQ